MTHDCARAHFSSPIASPAAALASCDLNPSLRTAPCPYFVRHACTQYDGPDPLYDVFGLTFAVDVPRPGGGMATVPLKPGA